MKTYTFIWTCDAARGEIEMDLSDEEVELIREAYENGFEELADDTDLEDILERALSKIGFYDPDLGQDIRVYFPEEITETDDEE